jgi:hypothetical protein
MKLAFVADPGRRVHADDRLRLDGTGRFKRSRDAAADASS